VELALGIDIGTSGVRTAVVDANGEPLSMARTGHAAQDPDRIDARLWWQAAADCIRSQVEALTSAGRDPRHVRRIAVDGTSGTMVLTDANLEPVTRSLMYNSKGFEKEARLISRFAPPAHIAQGSNSALARAMRLFGEDIDGHARHLLHQADYVAARLTLKGGHSDFNNSLKTGFDPLGGQWPDWLGSVGIDPSTMPRAGAPGAVLAPLAPAVAKDLGLSPSAIVHRGTTDSIAAFLACAEPQTGAAVTSLGTTLAVKVMSPTRIDDPEIGLYSHRLGNLWLVGGASNTGGGVLAHFFSADRIRKLSESIDPSRPSGLDYYPLIEDGERFPVCDPRLKPRLTPRPKDDVLFLQGMLEGIARIENCAYRAIEARGGLFPKEIHTAGGGSANRTWSLIRQNMLGVKVRGALHSEASVGSAKLAMSCF